MPFWSIRVNTQKSPCVACILIVGDAQSITFLPGIWGLAVAVPISGKRCSTKDQEHGQLIQVAPLLTDICLGAEVGGWGVVCFGQNFWDVSIPNAYCKWSVARAVELCDVIRLRQLFSVCRVMAVGTTVLTGRAAAMLCCAAGCLRVR